MIKREVKLFSRLLPAAVIALIISINSCYGTKDPNITQNEAKLYKHLLKKPATPDQAEKQASQLIAAMTPEERFSLACCDGIGLPGFMRLGIPPINFADASAGINNNPPAVRLRHAKSISYPCLLLLTATWNPEIMQSYARSIGEECRSAGTHLLVGPGTNFYRLSVCGRNWEYDGEDPYLASRMIESYVKGLQSTGTGATLKVFVGNEMEFHRVGSNSMIDERTLNEVYMAPFRAGIDAGALSVMTAYNQLNGEWCSQSKYVNTTLLRQNLGFRYMIMTDWGGTHDGVKFAKSGGDLENPYGWALKLDRAKVFGTPDIDRMALNILKTCIFAGWYEDPSAKPDLLANRPQWEKTALETNHEGIVLLQNNGILPLSSSQSGKTILLSGNNATREELSGAGSGHVKGYNLKTYVKAVTETFADANVAYVEKPTDDQIRRADFVLLFPGFPLVGKERESEAADRPFILPDDKLIARCAELNPKTIVCLTAGGGVAMDWAQKSAAIIHCLYGGQTGAAAVADILTGKVNPSGKLPFTVERRLEDSSAFEDLVHKPNTERPYPVSSFNRFTIKYFANNFFISPDKTQYYVYDVNYREGVFVGYRWYEQKKLPVRFWFGHGLSYTSFAYDNLKVKPTGKNTFDISFTLKNTGKRAGAEVAQVYVRDIQCSVPRPLKELKGFQKVPLKPGESKKVTITLGPEAFRFWDVKTSQWKIEPGEFAILVGASSQDIKLSKNIVLQGKL